METRLRALSQWDVVNGTTTAPVPADVSNPDETRQLEAWKLRAARAYAEIALRVDDDYGEVIATVTTSRWLRARSWVSIFLRHANNSCH